MQESSRALSPAIRRDRGPQSIRILKAAQATDIARQEARSGTPFREHDEGERTAWGIVALPLNPRLESGTPSVFSWCANSPGASRIAGLSSGKTVEVRVTAANDADESGPSDEVSAVVP